MSRCILTDVSDYAFGARVVGNRLKNRLPAHEWSCRLVRHHVKCRAEHVRMHVPLLLKMEKDREMRTD